jgi:hypothetical protein
MNIFNTIGSSRQPSSWQILFSPKMPSERLSIMAAPSTEYLNLILRAHLAINELLAGRNPTRSGVPLSGLTSIAERKNRIPMLRLQRLQYKLSFSALNFLDLFTWGQAKVFISTGRWTRWWTVQRGNVTQRVSNVCVICTVWKLGARELRTYRVSSELPEPTTEN